MSDKWDPPKPPSDGRLHPEVRRRVRRETRNAHKVLLEASALSSSRMNRSTGVGIGDVWNDLPPGEVRKVDDARANKVFCRDCKAEVTTVEVEGRWETQNTDGSPHQCERDPTIR